MTGTPPSTRYRRSERLLWRVLPGTVLTQRVDGDPGEGAAELSGMAAMVWVALEEPGTVQEIAEALGLHGDDAFRQLDEAIGQLTDSGHVQRG